MVKKTISVLISAFLGQFLPFKLLIYSSTSSVLSVSLQWKPISDAYTFVKLRELIVLFQFFPFFYVKNLCIIHAVI